jgi:hypothetical protein
MSAINDRLLPPAYVEPSTSPDWNAIKNPEPVIAVIKDVNDDAKGRALNTLMDDAKNKKLMQDHIGRLAEETLTVRQAFQDIANLLIEFDSKHYSDASGTAVPAQYDAWKRLADVRAMFTDGMRR